MQPVTFSRMYTTKFSFIEVRAAIPRKKRKNILIHTDRKEIKLVSAYLVMKRGDKQPVAYTIIIIAN